MHRPWSEQVLGSNSRPACQRACDFGQAVSLFLLLNDVPKVVERTQRSQYLQSAQGTQPSSPLKPLTLGHTPPLCVHVACVHSQTQLWGAGKVAFPLKGWLFPQKPKKWFLCTKRRRMLQANSPFGGRFSHEVWGMTLTKSHWVWLSPALLLASCMVQPRHYPFWASVSPSV